MKKVFLVCTLSAIMGTVQVLRNSDADNSDSLLKENVEALSSGDASPCNNINGFKKWKDSSLFSRKEHFYDCCSVLRDGYKPSEKCEYYH